MIQTKRNEKGFTIIELLIVLLLVGLIGAVGWYTWRASNKHGNGSPRAQTTEPQKSRAYTFKELGVTMDILDGWEVKANPTQEEGVNFYDWTVEKAGADGKIELSSTGFRGGFYGCAEMNDPLTAATVKDVARTRNSKLSFMSWRYKDQNEIRNSTGIVLADETVFRTTSDSTAAAILNKDIKAGDYFFCLSEPAPGFSLRLNKEQAPGFSRRDSITALSSSSSDTNYVPLSPNAKSYANIKAMLTSIR